MTSFAPPVQKAKASSKSQGRQWSPPVGVTGSNPLGDAKPRKRKLNTKGPKSKAATQDVRCSHEHHIAEQAAAAAAALLRERSVRAVDHSGPAAPEGGTASVPTQSLHAHARQGVPVNDAATRDGWAGREGAVPEQSRSPRNGYGGAVKGGGSPYFRVEEDADGDIVLKAGERFVQDVEAYMGPGGTRLAAQVTASHHGFPNGYPFKDRDAPSGYAEQHHASHQGYSDHQGQGKNASHHQGHSNTQQQQSSQSPNHGNWSDSVHEHQRDMHGHPNPQAAPPPTDTAYGQGQQHSAQAHAHGNAPERHQHPNQHDSWAIHGPVPAQHEQHGAQHFEPVPSHYGPSHHGPTAPQRGAREGQSVHSSGEYIANGFHGGFNREDAGAQRTGPFLRALAGIMAGPSEQQRALAEEGKERLKRDLEEQIEEKRQRNQERKAKELQAELKEEAKFQSYINARQQPQPQVEQAPRPELASMRRRSAIGGSLAEEPPRVSGTMQPGTNTSDGAYHQAHPHGQHYAAPHTTARHDAQTAAHESTDHSAQPRREEAAGAGHDYHTVLHVGRSNQAQAAYDSSHSEAQHSGQSADSGAGRSRGPASSAHVPELLQELHSEQQLMRSKFEQHMQALSHIERDAAAARQQQSLALEELHRVHEMLKLSTLAPHEPTPAAAPMSRTQPQPPRGMAGHLHDSLDDFQPQKTRAHGNGMREETQAQEESCFLSVHSHLLPLSTNCIPDNPELEQMPAHAVTALRDSAGSEGRGSGQSGQQPRMPDAQGRGRQRGRKQAEDDCDLSEELAQRRGQRRLPSPPILSTAHMTQVEQRKRRLQELANPRVVARSTREQKSRSRSAVRQSAEEQVQRELGWRW